LRELDTRYSDDQAVDGAESHPTTAVSVNAARTRLADRTPVIVYFFDSTVADNSGSQSWGEAVCGSIAVPTIRSWPHHSFCAAGTEGRLNRRNRLRKGFIDTEQQLLLAERYKNRPYYGSRSPSLDSAK